MMQSLVPALYPMIKDGYSLSFAQIGLITLTMQVISSMLQPLVGLAADHRPQPYSLAVGMCSTLAGLLLLAGATHYLTAAARRSADGRRLGGVPSRGVARGAAGLGRRAAARPRAIAVPGRRQYRLGDRADPRRLYRHPARPGQRRLVLGRGAAGDGRAVPASATGTGASIRRRARARYAAARAARPVAPAGRSGRWRSCCRWCSPRRSTRRASAPITPST